MDGKGKEWPCETKALRDERTGARLWQITSHPSTNHHLYFLTGSFLPDEQSLIFASFRGGAPNFYRAGFPEGPIIQLTCADEINSFSATVSGDGSTLYFTRGGSIIALDMDDLSERDVASFPEGTLGEVDVSADGKWLVSALRMSDEHGIAVAAADGSHSSIIHRQIHPIIHPQFHPHDSNLIEYAVDPAPRIRLIQRDGSGIEILYEHENSEFVTHESWLGDTGDIAFTYWPNALMRLALPSCETSTLAEFNAWHTSSSRDGRLILCDTNHPDIGLQLVETATGRRATVCYPESSNSGSQWKLTRYAEKADFEAAAKANTTDVETESSWMDMKTDTVYGPQWTHPHPSFSPSCRLAAFTSDRTGHSQVYVVEISQDILATAAT